MLIYRIIDSILNMEYKCCLFVCCSKSLLVYLKDSIYPLSLPDQSREWCEDPVLGSISMQLGFPVVCPDPSRRNLPVDTFNRRIKPPEVAQATKLLFFGRNRTPVILIIWDSFFTSPELIIWCWCCICLEQVKRRSSFPVFRCQRSTLPSAHALTSILSSSHIIAEFDEDKSKSRIPSKIAKI